MGYGCQTPVNKRKEKFHNLKKKKFQLVLKKKKPKTKQDLKKNKNKKRKKIKESLSLSYTKQNIAADIYFHNFFLVSLR